MISYVLGKGLIDTYKAKNKMWDYSVPTTFKEPALRIDYIFCSRDLNVVNSGIIKTT